MLAERIPEQGSVIAFRNLLIHGYATVFDELVWNDLPVLRTKVAQLLEDLSSQS